MEITILKILITTVFVFMIYMNYLANAKPLNNRTQQDIAADYPALFTPSGYAFSIWGMIYILLGVFVFKTLLTGNNSLTEPYMITLMILFSVTSVLNILWLLSWHYDFLILSTLIMSLFLAANIIIVNIIPNNEGLLKLTFSLYLGWIMVAFIANITITLVKFDIPVFKKHEVFWYLAVITIGLVIVALVLIFNQNVMIGLVFIWAYLAIFLKHRTKDGYYLKTNGPIIYTGVVLVVIIILTVGTFIFNGFQMFI